jgi:hypothetical protein
MIVLDKVKRKRVKGKEISYRSEFIAYDHKNNQCILRLFKSNDSRNPKGIVVSLAEKELELLSDKDVLPQVYRYAKEMKRGHKFIVFMLTKYNDGSSELNFNRFVDLESYMGFDEDGFIFNEYKTYSGEVAGQYVIQVISISQKNYCEMVESQIFDHFGGKEKISKYLLNLINTHKWDNK